jgi:hypothetical protein
MSTPLPDQSRPFELKSEIRAALQFLRGFVFNPVQSLKHTPEWSWPATVIVIGIVAIVLGALTGFGGIRFSPFRVSLTAIIGGIIVSPISALFVTSVLAAVVKYSALFIFHTQIPFKRALTLVFLACVPWMVVSPVIDQLPALSPIGAILSALLGIVAFSENTHLNLKNSLRIIGTIAGTFIVFWIIHMVSSSSGLNDSSKQIPEESLQILEQEMEGPVDSSED